MNQPTPSMLIQHTGDSEDRDEPGEQQERGKAAGSRDALHLMPFSIDYHGPAEISKYFLTRPVSANDPSSARANGKQEDVGQQKLECFEGSFRGRYLHGTRLAIPEGYTGLVLSSSSSSPASSSQQPDQSAHPKASSSHQAGPQPTTSRTRGRGRGRGRGRARGQRVGQVNGTRPPATRGQLKRTQSQADGFLDSDSDAEQDAQNENSTQPALKDTFEVPSRSGPEATAQPDHPPQHDPPPSIAILDSAPVPKPEPFSPPIMLDQTPSLLTGPDPRLAGEGPIPASLQLPQPKVLASMGERFDQITIWNPDHQLDLTEDVYARALHEWVGLSHLVSLARLVLPPSLLSLIPPKHRYP
ncbi:hypothetical protein PCANC_25255 [Puccinia coronata f. sp. avenae]|uniref:Uncharacterized protein n=1 Tax=Puccinia coronata f. sp. avenae TaxID=200324 RepID=A0A2N5RZT1_9BASI|nr:hypothetical protein PCANC_25255 [Puccinia coronata f. sp. avenae]